ncbi:transcription factor DYSFUNCTIONAL TAPETUM 1 [Trifolium pratense]|uniref:Transcription factor DYSFUNCTIONAL TAPETUM 1 n=1 Tax=Trifolium pratense TaxID=57577 RepID=A0A2K3N2Z0_TRIPR|nr:transcription factor DYSFUNCTIONAL TAPETUM 1 [Trifolium pratense]
MEQENNHRLSVSVEDLGFNNGSNMKGKLSQKHYDDAGPKLFISKNLETERKRREKLGSRLLMNKASIIEDAITYTKMLQKEVEILTKELDEMEETRKKKAEQKTCESSAAGEKINISWIEEEIQVAKIDGNMLWAKMIIEHKRGRFQKLVEDLHTSNIEMIDLSVTTIEGAYLITATLKGMGGEPIELYQIPTIIKFK